MIQRPCRPTCHHSPSISFAMSMSSRSSTSWEWLGLDVGGARNTPSVFNLSSLRLDLRWCQKQSFQMPMWSKTQLCLSHDRMMQNMYFITLESTILNTMHILETTKKQLADLASKARSGKTRKRPLPKSEDSVPQNVSWHLVTIKCIVKIWWSHVSNCILWCDICKDLCHSCFAFGNCTWKNIGDLDIYHGQLTKIHTTHVNDLLSMSGSC